MEERYLIARKGVLIGVCSEPNCAMENHLGLEEWIHVSHCLPSYLDSMSANAPNITNGLHCDAVEKVEARYWWRNKPLREQADPVGDACSAR